MAFLNRVGSVLKQTVSKQISSQIGSQISASNTSLYQALRCMSSSQLFVGGLSSTVDDSILRKMFSPHGKVVSAKIVIDKEQNKPRGFGFVSFSSTEEADTAIKAMDGQNVQGRKMKVNYVAGKAPSNVASKAPSHVPSKPPSPSGGGGVKSSGYSGVSARGGASKVVAAGNLGHSAVNQFENSFPVSDAEDFDDESDVEPDDFVKRAYARKTSKARRG